MTTAFRSKVDGKLVAMGLAVPCAALIAIAMAPRLPTEVLYLPIAVIAFTTAIVVWVVASTYYEFVDDLLLVHSGPFSWRIPFQQIHAVRESTSARSGPALSMDRLEITYGSGQVLLVSPEDKATFIAALRRRAPQLA